MGQLLGIKRKIFIEKHPKMSLLSRFFTWENRREHLRTPYSIDSLGKAIVLFLYYCRYLLNIICRMKTFLELKKLFWILFGIKDQFLCFPVFFLWVWDTITFKAYTGRANFSAVRESIFRFLFLFIKTISIR